MQIFAIQDQGTAPHGFVDGDGFDMVEASLVPDNLSGPDRMNTLALHLIMGMRPSAVDHECQLPDHDGEHFHGAALVRTSEGRFFLSPNMQTSDDNTDRNCAEKNALSQSMERRKPGEVITDIWFTGGLANFSEGIEIADGEQGRRPKPCCVCLDALHRDNPGMQVHLLPLRPAVRGVSLTDHSPGTEDLADDEVLTVPLSDLYRPTPVVVSDPAQKAELAETTRFLQQPPEDPRELRNGIARAFGKVATELTNGDGLAAVNEILMQNLRQLFHLPGNNLRYAEIAIVRNAEGRLFGATSFTNGRTPSTPPAVSKAVHAATNNSVYGDVTAAYYMRIDVADLKALAAELDGAGDFAGHPDVVFHLPGGSALERLRKGSAHYRHSPAESGGQQVVPIHMILPNRISDFDPQRHVHTVNLGDIVPHPYRGLKLVQAQRHDAVEGAPSPATGLDHIL